MKSLLSTLLFVLTFGLSTSIAQSDDSIFEFKPNQSMLLTGKEPGQNGAKNPFEGKDCVATVENLEQSVFEVRIQKGNEIIEIKEVQALTTKDFRLKPGYQLYIDTKLKSRAKITFKAFVE